MKIDIPRPRFSYDQIRKIVQEFLNTYHPSLELPIPIEEIIDLKLKLNISPFPNLYRTWRQNGFLSSDLTTITVDEYQYNNYWQKYRFTLAHELGHFILHRNVYESFNFSDQIDEYIKWRMSIPGVVIDTLERQSDNFAGLILVPEKTLFSECKQTIEKYKSEIKEFLSSGIEPEEIWEYLPQKIAIAYDVSPIVMDIRIDKDKISSRIDLREF